MKELEIIRETLTVLKKGGVILYPTDTIWGIGCDATNLEAIKKVYAIKKRQKNKPLILLVDDIKILENYVKAVPEIAYKIIQTEKEPTTIIYENPIKLPQILITNNTIGIRVVKNKMIKKFLKKFNKPIISTSANISNNNTPKNYSEVDNHIKMNVDYIIPELFSNNNIKPKSSKIIKIIDDENIQIIRN